MAIQKYAFCKFRGICKDALGEKPECGCQKSTMQIFQIKETWHVQPQIACHFHFSLGFREQPLWSLLFEPEEMAGAPLSPATPSLQTEWVSSYQHAKSHRLALTADLQNRCGPQDRRPSTPDLAECQKEKRTRAITKQRRDNTHRGVNQGYGGKWK